MWATREFWVYEADGRLWQWWLAINTRLVQSIEKVGIWSHCACHWPLFSVIVLYNPIHWLFFTASHCIYNCYFRAEYKMQIISFTAKIIGVFYDQLNNIQHSYTDDTWSLIEKYRLFWIWERCKYNSIPMTTTINGYSLFRSFHY